MILSTKIMYLLFFLFSVGLTYGLRVIALKKNVLDIPNHRSLHVQPTPRGGGFAFVIVFYCAVVFFNYFFVVPDRLFFALLGGIPVALVGYLDDLGGVKSLWRIMVHFLSAVWGVACLGGVSFFDFGAAIITVPWLLSLLAILLTVWFINLYNFMDGIDGLAGMEAVFVAAAAGSILFLQGNVDIAAVCFVLAISVLGFLVWNWPPAKIFMGDIGSGFLGYIFAILMWATNNQHQLPLPFWWVLMAVFLVDASWTLLHRMKQKKQWYLAHREHVYQRLIQSGCSHFKVTVSVCFINILVCLPLALFYLKVSTLWGMGGYFAAFVLVSFCVWYALMRKYQAN